RGNAADFARATSACVWYPQSLASPGRSRFGCGKRRQAGPRHVTITVADSECREDRRQSSPTSRQHGGHYGPNWPLAHFALTLARHERGVAYLHALYVGDGI